jgi:hypothetical protein
MKKGLPCQAFWVWCAAAAMATAASGAPVVYRCPGNIITNEMPARQAQQQGCQALTMANVTVLPESLQPAVPASAAVLPASIPASAPVAPPAPARRVTAPVVGLDKGGGQVSAGEQRARDSDAHTILSTELKREQTKLTALRQSPASTESAAAMARSEADISALERELARQPGKAPR